MHKFCRIHVQCKKRALRPYVVSKGPEQAALMHNSIRAFVAQVKINWILIAMTELLGCSG